MLKNWHIIISGFTQHEAKISGMTKLWLELGKFRSPETTIALREWNACWESVAEAIWWSSLTPEELNVNIYAYSWGAGWGFVNLARHLRNRGININTAVLSDPVYRHKYWAGQWRALVPWSTVTVPANVKEVHWFRQHQNLPAGHNLVAADSNLTKINLPVVLTVTHPYMDDSYSFHSRALRSAEELHAVK